MTRTGPKPVFLPATPSPPPLRFPSGRSNEKDRKTAAAGHLVFYSGRVARRQPRVSRPRTAGCGFDSSGLAGRLNQRRGRVPRTSFRDTGVPSPHPNLLPSGEKAFPPSIRRPPMVLRQFSSGNGREALFLGTEESFPLSSTRTPLSVSESNPDRTQHGNPSP